MKKILSYFTAIVLSVCFFGACSDDNNLKESSIQILFPVQILDIDMNTMSNPPVVSVVNSENPLRSVDLFVLKGDVVEKQGASTTKFFNPKSHSINEAILYTGDMTGVRVVAVDVAGTVVEKELMFNVKQMVGAPEIVFVPTEIVMDEGSQVPPFVINVHAKSPLKSIMLYSIINNVQAEAEDPIVDFDNQQEYAISSDFLNLESIFVPGVTGLKVEAEDAYGKVRIMTLPITFNELPSPVVTFDQATLQVNESEELIISGTIEASFNLASATFTLKGKDETIPDYVIETVDYTMVSLADPKKATFSYTIPSFSVDYNAIEVNVVDVLPKNTIETKDITVISLPSPVIAVPEVGGKPVSLEGIETTATISLAGYVATSPDAILESYKATTTLIDGTEADILNVSGINATKYTPTLSPFTPDQRLRKITITATNQNGKVTTLKIPVSVGCWILKNVIFNEQETAGDAKGSTQLFAFSASLRRSITLKEFFDDQASGDFTFYVASSTSTTNAQNIRWGGFNNSSLSTKYAHSTYGYPKWTIKNTPNTNLISDYTNVSDRNDYFDNLTAADLVALNIPVSSATQTRNITYQLLQMFSFETIARDGKVQRGVLRVDGIVDEHSGDLMPELPAGAPGYKISTTIILSTPYTK